LALPTEAAADRGASFVITFDEADQGTGILKMSGELLQLIDSDTDAWQQQQPEQPMDQSPRCLDSDQDYEGELEVSEKFGGDDNNGSGMEARSLFLFGAQGDEAPTTEDGGGTTYDCVKRGGGGMFEGVKGLMPLLGEGGILPLLGEGGLFDLGLGDEGFGSSDGSGFGGGFGIDVSKYMKMLVSTCLRELTRT
jgi:hypothetical protein